MMQIPSVDWPRRTNPLTGSEDLLKQNPVTDSFPQEERIPVSLISNFTLSNLSYSNVGTGIGTFDFRNGNEVQFRSLAANSNKVSVGLSGKTILLDVNANNIASSISITSLSGVTGPTASNQYLMWDGGGYVFNSSPFSFNVTANNPPSSLNISNGSTLNIIGGTPIVSTIAMGAVVLNFNGGLNVLNDVNIVGSVPNGYVLGYNSSTSKWGPISPAAASSYSFNMKGDGVDIFNVANLSTVSILGNGGTITTSVAGTNEIEVDWAANLSDLLNVSTQAPLNNQALVYNSGTSKWEPKTIGGSGSYVFTNGLTALGSTVKLGGTLSEHTVIYGDQSNYDLIFTDLRRFILQTQNDTGGEQHIFNVASNGVQGNTTFTALNSADAYSQVINIHSKFFKKIDIDSYDSINDERFRLQTTTTDAGVYFLRGGLVECGFKVQEDKIVVMDGVNTPSAGHVLTYMVDGSAQFQPVSGSGGSASYNFSNGLTENNGDVEFGGVLTQNTFIDGDNASYDFIFNNLSSYRHSTENGVHESYYSENQIAGYTVIQSTNNSTGTAQSFRLSSEIESISLNSVRSNLTDEFVVQTTTHDVGIFFQQNAMKKVGFLVEEDNVRVLDGVNETPAIGDVLAYTVNDTIEYTPIYDLLTGGTDGDYLGVVASSVTWVSPKERISLCEFDSNVNIAIGNGLKFFVVPTEMDGWTIDEFTASVYLLGSGISTRFELLVNGVAVVGSALTMGGKFDSNTGINYVVSEGDTISINVLNTKPTPDKGLSVTITLTK